MVISVPRLTSIISEYHPLIQKPNNYAKLLKLAYDLGITNRGSSVPPREFIRRGINYSTISAPYKKYNLLNVVAGGSRIILPLNARGYDIIGNDSGLKSLLDLERNNLYRHLRSDQDAREFVTKILKLNITTSVVQISKKMSEGNLRTQLVRYDKVYTKMESEKFLDVSYNYKWAGFRPIPSDTYYLSAKALKIINEC